MKPRDVVGYRADICTTQERESLDGCVNLTVCLTPVVGLCRSESLWGGDCATT